MAFKVNVLGAGPAGMYTAASLKKAIPFAEISLYEKRKREEVPSGMGYVFVPDLFSHLDLIDDKISKNLSEDSVPWNVNTIITKEGRVITGRPSWICQGVLRSNLMSELERVVVEKQISINYERVIDANNLANYQDADLVIVTTGVKRFLPNERAKPFKMVEAESPVNYCWLAHKNNLDTHIFSLGKLGNVPFAVNKYPVSKDRSAVITEVLDENLADFCTETNKLGLSLTPDNFSPVRIRASVRPLVGNVLLLGDAACNPYFCTGAGLLTAFYAASKLTECVSAEVGTLGERLNMFSQGLGQYYLKTFQDSREMIDRKALVLANFDKICEAEQISLLTSVRLK
ncbi:MAG: hypothetical protein AABX35_04170 [Nanoarchaeota archaeon]